MTRQRTFSMATGLLLAAACSNPVDLAPTQSCVGESSEARASFEDPALEGAVRQALGLAGGANLTCAGMASLTELDASEAGVTSLQGIQNLVNLRVLDVTGNAISDLRPLSGLEILQVLFISSSGLTTLDGIQSLESLTFLDAHDNAIADLAPLARLTGLQFLDLTGNGIGDVGPLAGLTGLLSVRLGDNSISDLDALRGLSNVLSVSLFANEVTDLTPLTGLTALSTLDLSQNISLSDIQPLIDSPNFRDGDTVNLRETAVDCPSVDALRSKGVSVDHGCV